MDPDTIRSLRSRIQKDLLPYCEGGSVIPFDLSQTVRVRSTYDPNGSGLQILGIRSRDPFSGSTDISDRYIIPRPYLTTYIIYFHTAPIPHHINCSLHRSPQRVLSLFLSHLSLTSPILFNVYFYGGPSPLSRPLLRCTG